MAKRKPLVSPNHPAEEILEKIRYLSLRHDLFCLTEYATPGKSPALTACHIVNEPLDKIFEIDPEHPDLRAWYTSGRLTVTRSNKTETLTYHWYVNKTHMSERYLDETLAYLNDSTKSIPERIHFCDKNMENIGPYLRQALKTRPPVRFQWKQRKNTWKIQTGTVFITLVNYDTNRYTINAHARHENIPFVLDTKLWQEGHIEDIQRETLHIVNEEYKNFLNAYTHTATCISCMESNALRENIAPHKEVLFTNRNDHETQHLLEVRQKYIYDDLYVPDNVLSLLSFEESKESLTALKRALQADKTPLNLVQMTTRQGKKTKFEIIDDCTLESLIPGITPFDSGFSIYLNHRDETFEFAYQDRFDVYPTEINFFELPADPEKTGKIKDYINKNEPVSETFMNYLLDVTTDLYARVRACLKHEEHKERSKESCSDSTTEAASSSSKTESS